MKGNPYLKLSQEVESALKKHQPIVALESTIISHGMPYPDNYNTAKGCEKIIRDGGCVPATVAIIDGVIHVGLEDTEVLRLAQHPETVLKVSRLDIPWLLSQKLTGAMTVAATMIACDLAGIRVFATGGIGGVHRGAETTFDISADLEELAHTDVIVVSAGMKSILDLPKTLEYLETHGVAVLGYQTDRLPAFYNASSDLFVNYRVDNADQIAQMFLAKQALHLKGGLIVANPVPADYSFPKPLIDKAIAAAEVDMKALGITGKATTPYLLKRIGELTEGQSLRTNIALVYNNCRLAAEIAKAMVEGVAKR